MKTALGALALSLAMGACGPGQPQSPLDRCVEEKMAEYDRLYPGEPEEGRQIARDGHRIFCEIYLSRPERQGNLVR
jgi:hypothetical protein